MGGQGRLCPDLERADNAQTVRLPHDAMIGARAYADSPAGADGAYRDGASYVYYKELYAPERWRDQTLKLYFEGVSRSAMVYVNNQRAALVPYAYTAFYVEPDDYLKYGQVNQIRVCVRTGTCPTADGMPGAVSIGTSTCWREGWPISRPRASG